ncbi:MAG: hypothetical protein OXJ64_20620 [Boseongicola sp.]|nr:hypothetical protein [Boseongicola sp.]
MVDFSFVYSTEQDVVRPTGEGRVQAARSVDRYGDPDLMAEFAKEYLKQHWMLLRRGQLPRTFLEVMPSLLLLVTAAELGLKAFLLRSKGDRPRDTHHDLVKLFDDLDPRHQTAIESRFQRCESAAGLSAIGVDPPQVRAILGTYADMYGGNHGVYEEARYMAEPTTRLPNDLQGANMVKTATYPIFMPYLVEAIVACYPAFSGAERLRNGGAEVSKDESRKVASHGHGEWLLRPSSLGLVVLMVSQQEGMDNPDFEAFKAHHPTSFEADWMYGGSTLLFYDASDGRHRDGVETVSGIECRVISEELVRMHARDLNRLANRLEAISDGDPPLDNLPV